MDARENQTASNTNANLPILFEFKYSFCGIERFAWFSCRSKLLLCHFDWYSLELYTPDTCKLICAVGNQRLHYQNLKFMSLKFVYHLRLTNCNNQLTVLFNNISVQSVGMCLFVCVHACAVWKWKIFGKFIFNIFCQLKNPSIAHKFGLIHKIQWNCT